LKTRIMLERRQEGEDRQKRRGGALRLFRQIQAEHGTGGFFRGFVPRVGWISTGGAIFLGTYQWAYNKLAQQAGPEKSANL